MSYLAELRRGAGLTQTGLAELVGTSSAYISQLETGHRNPSAELIGKLVGVLDCTFEDLRPTNEGATK